MFDHNAAVGDDLQSRRGCTCHCVCVERVELQPDGPGSDADGGLDDLGDELRSAKDIDDIRRSTKMIEIRNSRKTADELEAGVYRDDSEAGGVQILSHPVAVSGRVCRHADHRDRLRGAEQG